MTSNNLLSEKEILEIFRKTNALLEGHFLLTSGRHSNKYFQCAKVLQYPEYTTKLCEIISNHFKDFEIDTIIAPAIGGIIVGQEVARQLKFAYGLNVKFIFAEREDKELILRRGFSLEKGEKVLVCEDVVTTGGSVFEVIDIVKQNEAEVVGVGIIVDRSGGKVKFDYPSISTLKMEVVSFSAAECNLCSQGIPLIKPGSRKVNVKVK